MPVTIYYCDYAWLGGDVAEAGIAVTVGDGRIVSVDAVPAPPGSLRLAGLTLPGFANAHSHAFHRALRARSERGTGSFWTWREAMYGVADALTPERYYRLARAVYAEMALAGYSAVGEFHYLHHRPGGAPYEDPNEMAEALVAAASDAGLRLTLFDACYLEAAPGSPAEGVQRRFSDGDVDRWGERVEALAGGPAWRVGAAVHSLRAVPPHAAARVAAWARGGGRPLHFHLSEQPAENEAVASAYGASPTALLADAGVLGRSASAVHATHLGGGDLSLLAASGCGVCMCPSTERDLADGIGPAGRLEAAGCPLSLGSDSHAVVDPFEEMRALELDERLATGVRGRWSAAQLLAVATHGGHLAIGWPEAGRIAPGAVADLVTVSLESPRLAGVTEDCVLEHGVWAASAGDVTHVITSGRPVVWEGAHQLLDDVAGALASAVREVVAR